MSDTFWVSQWALIRRGELVDIPEKLEIHPDFLQKLSPEEFEGAFREAGAVFRQMYADFTEPITAGIFVSIAAWASYQRSEDKTPYWRTLKANGELNAKYPGGIEAHKEKLESEGHTVLQKGRKNIKYYVKDYEKAPFISAKYSLI